MTESNKKHKAWGAEKVLTFRVNSFHVTQMLNSDYAASVHDRITQFTSFNNYIF